MLPSLGALCRIPLSEIIPYLSTSKSPQQMLGALTKTYLAGKNNFDSSKIFSVSIMPCTAKKYECQRPEMNSSGFRDVDAVLTTRELAQMIKGSQNQLRHLDDESADLFGGNGSGELTIFGTAGGVMEAALRTAYESVTGNPLENLTFSPVNNSQFIKQASVDFNGTSVSVAAAYGIAAATSLVTDVLAEKSPYHFIEIMTCYGGCVNGGGQPIYSKEL